MKCPSCETENPAGMRFCGGCAAPLVDLGSPPAPFTASRQGDRPIGVLKDADRRPVTVLFADISGFTSLSEKLDPEVVRDLITACFDRLVPCIERCSGTIDKFIGDEVMALFGAPQAHENDPERALRAALEMRDTLSDFNREHGVGLGVHFGVNTGLVYAGGVGGGSRQDYSVMGDAVNVAARLKEAAKAGEILVGADTFRQTAHAFEFQLADTLSLKGRADPVAVRRLLSARPAPTTAHLDLGLSSPLVGREEELVLFRRSLERLSSGEGAVLVITGEAGLGKSRLVAEARASAEQQRIAWLEGHALSFGRTISYWPLLEIIQQDAGIESDDPERQRWEKLAARVGALFGGERNEILPYLATLLSLSLPEELAPKVRYLDAEAMGRQIYRVTRLYFARLAQKRPTVVVFEDVHWLDGSTASLLEHLLPLSGQVPVLFCLVSRPETETALGGLRQLLHDEHADRLTEIALRPLSPEESMALVRNLAHLDELPARLRDSILGKAEGNPFFVEEVIRSLIDFGGLVRDDATGTWRITEDAAHVTIPDTLQGVIMARIDRLDDDLKTVLRLASVVGRSFFYRVLASIAEADRELDRCLATLEARELILEKARDPELEYIFKHALVQEATYESILLARRKEVHRKVARAIETLFPERLDEFHALLAYHWSKAEHWEKAQDYLFKAGDQAGKIAADKEALAHYEEAIEAYGRSFGDKWNPFDRAMLQRKMGEALHRQGDHAQARDYLYQALATLGQPLPDSTRAVRREIARQVVAQIWHRAWPWFRPASGIPDAISRADELCRIYQSLGWIEGFADQARALLIMLTDLNLAEKEGIEWAASSGASAMGMMLMVMPAPRLSRSYVARAKVMAEQGGWPAEQAQADLIDGMREFWLAGNPARAEDCLRRSWESFRELGDIRSSAGIAMGVGVHVPAERGELKQALAMAREIGQSGRDAGDRLTEAYGQAWESELLYMMGDLEAGEAGMRSTIEAMLAATDYRISSKVAGRLAACLLVQGRLEEAQALLTEHRANVRRYGIRGFNGTMVITGTAAAALCAAERADGSSRDAALKEAKRACAAAVKQGRLDVTAFVPAYRLRGTYEWLSGHPGKADALWLKSLDHADRLGSRYEGALTMLERGRQTNDGAQLERAESEFEAMGCKFFLAQARRLLDAPEVARPAVVA